MSVDTVSRTPMMKQYEAAKKKVSSEHLLLFRLGDFFEFFYDDAIKASQILGITLTHRQGVSMCGVPAQSVERYIRALLEHGQKLALCDQVSAVEKGTLVERDIVEILSPGAVTNAAYLSSEKENNYLFALYEHADALYAAWIDVSIGELYVYGSSCSSQAIYSLIGQVAPRELVVPESALDKKWYKSLSASVHDACITTRPVWSYTAEEGRRLLRRCSNSEEMLTKILKALEKGNEQMFCAIGGLLEYVQSTIPTTSFKIHSFSFYSHEKHLELDSNVIYHLELFSTMRENDERYSLASTIDATQTSMGSRMLKNSIRMPLRIKHDIERRCDVVEYFLQNETKFQEVRAVLRSVYDIERLFTRVYLNKAHPKDLYRIGQSLVCAHEAYTTLVEKEQACTALFSHIFAGVDIGAIVEAHTLIHSALYEDPPTHFGDAPVVKEGYDPELDELRKTKQNEDVMLDDYVAELSESSATPLRLKYNSSFGYCFEFPHSMRGKLPPVFVLRQTLKNTDRYKTDVLVSIESKILHAQESLLDYEVAIFQRVCKSVAQWATTIHAMSQAIAHIDMLSAFAHVAREYGYTRPMFVDSHVLHIQGGRHPVVERMLTQGSFISNDIQLACKGGTSHISENAGASATEKSFVMLTGPNMAGKSTFLRQNALMLIMAHMGCFVPAESMVCGIFDKVFCRVGASDNLIKGESTFLTEMNETAFILNNATSKSLVIMDEIGRGTSVHDGTAIAQAVAEFLLDKNIFTLFATHYHDVAHLKRAQMQACTIAAVKHENDDIVFTHKITEGIADNSYGIEVAKRSGMPRSVLSRAYDILLEDSENDTKTMHDEGGMGQEDLFASTKTHDAQKSSEYEKTYKALRLLLRDVSIHSISPLQAHVILAEVCERVLKVPSSPS